MSNRRNLVYAFYQQQPDIAISLTLYNKLAKTIRRDFYLRNLSGQTEAEQVEQAKQIMGQVAEELHYLTGFGVDKGVIRVNGQKDALVSVSEFKEGRFVVDGVAVRTEELLGC